MKKFTVVLLFLIVTITSYSQKTWLSNRFIEIVEIDGVEYKVEDQLISSVIEVFGNLNYVKITNIEYSITLKLSIYKVEKDIWSGIISDINGNEAYIFFDFEVGAIVILNGDETKMKIFYIN